MSTKKKPTKQTLFSRSKPPAKTPHEFALEQTGAHEVLLVGDFTDWTAKPITMARGGNGEWKAAVALPPGTYQYRFIVDGRWESDPTSPERVPNSFGSENSLCVVAEG